MTNVTGRKILYDGKPVQVDSAIRDGTGLVIDTTYAKKSEMPFQLIDTTVEFVANTDASTSTDYPYRAAVTINGITANTYAEVIYSDAQNDSGDYANFCVTDTDTLYLYARSDVGEQQIPTISIGMERSLVTDSTPTSGSANPISSGGVYTALTNGSVTKIGTATVGGDLKPVYLNAGVPTAVANNFVDIASAQEITGRKTMVTPLDNYSLLFRSSTVARSDPVSSFTRLNQLQMTDKDGAGTGYIQNYLDGNGNLITNYGTASPNGTNREIRVVANNSEGYVTIPNRTYNPSNTSDVVTIGSLQASSDVVHRTGNEPVSGVKTFNDTIQFVDSGHGIGRQLESTRSSVLLLAQSPNDTTGARLYIRANNDGTVSLVLGKWVGGSFSSTTVASI